MAKETVYRVRCDKCSTVVELAEPFSPLPMGWEHMMLNPTDNDYEGASVHMCTKCMREWRIWMGWDMGETPTEDDPMQSFGFGTMA